MTVQQIYEQTIKPLSPREQLQLASFILNDIAGRNLDASDEWSDDDLRDFSAAGWQHIDNALTDSKDGQDR